MSNEKIEIEKLNLNSMSIAEERQKELLQLFPEIRTEDGKVDFEKLRLALGEVVDAGKERYGMNWPGKAECFTTIQTASQATLRPLIDKSINFGKSENIFIEGDNLESLKLLQKGYFGKIKIIYIDPPYNTGKDFIYPDNYSESISTYLQYTNQIDSEGKRFSTTTETDGRFHSKWLNMMFTRLFLARNLLKNDGLIFISIDDKELPNLRLIGNEIFGEENFVGCFVWQSKKGGGSDSKTIVKDHEYIVCYAKSSPEESVSRLTLESEELNQADEHGPFRLGRELNKWGSNSRRVDRPTMWFSIPGPDGSEVFPIRNDGTEGCWRYGKTKMNEFVVNHNIHFVKRDDGTYIAYEKIRDNDPREKPFRTFLTVTGTTADGSKTVKELFGGKKIFDFPKPVDLIKHIIDIGSKNDDDIVLDFFAGSGTTAQAVLEYNTENQKALSFICIQLPETLSEDSEAKREGFKTISEICLERIKKAIVEIKEKSSQLNLAEADSGTNEAIFNVSVFKLDDSNFKIWSQETDTKEGLTKQLELHVDHVKHERTPDDILFEILLKSGFPLTTNIETQKFGKQTVYSIAGGMLLVCLEDNLSLELIKYIAEQKPERVVCLDQGFANNDQLKANAVQIFRTKGIASFKTV